MAYLIAWVVCSVFLQVHTDVTTQYIYTFSYQSNTYYLQHFSNAEFGEDQSFYLNGKRTITADESLRKILLNCPDQPWYQDLIQVDVSGFDFFDRENVYLLKGRTRTNQQIYRFDEIEWIDVTKGHPEGKEIVTPLNTGDIPWIEQQNFELIKELKMDDCIFSIYTSNTPDENARAMMEKLSTETNPHEFQILANKLKAQGILVFKRCSC